MNGMTRLVGAVVACAFLGMGCGDSGESSSPAKTNAAGSAKVEKPAEKPVEKMAEVPPAAEAVVASTSSGPHDAAKGEAMYGQFCSSCHGPRGAGDGPVGLALNPKPARHNDGAYMNALSNDHLFKVVKEGGASVGKSALMAAWGGTLGDEDIWHIVAFVRTLAEPAYTGPKP